MGYQRSSHNYVLKSWDHTRRRPDYLFPGGSPSIGSSKSNWLPLANLVSVIIKIRDVELKEFEEIRS